MALEINIVWTITAALMVYFMHAGFGFYEAGMCRSKNTVDTLSHNLLILSVTIVIYWAVGFAFMFGQGSSFIGYSGFMPQVLDLNNSYPSLLAFPVPLVVAFAFAMSFADTPATLIAGTGAERIRLSAVMILTVLISGIVFPTVGHWILGGGWLTKLDVPIYDTGSGMIHLCGGCCALAVAVVIGARKERDEESDEKNEDGEQVSSMPLVFLGALILWLGFFGFNAGLAMKASKSIGLIFANTALAGSAGSIMGIVGAQLWTGKARLRTAIVGLLTANVAVTSPSAVIEPWVAVLIGATAGIVAVFSITLWAKLGIDDPTEYLTMNFIGGLLGIISVGIFSSPAIISNYTITPVPKAGLIYGGGTAQLETQIIAALAIIGFVFPVALAACAILRSLKILRVELKEEIKGSDSSTHGEKAYGKKN